MSEVLLNGGNAAFIEELYEQYRQNPRSVTAEWRRYFEEIRLGVGQYDELAVTTPQATPSNDWVAEPVKTSQSQSATDDFFKQVAVWRLIESYRVRGHQDADVDPLHLRKREPVVDLAPSFHGLEPADLDKKFAIDASVDAERASLKQIIERFKSLYCGSVGAEYMHITDTEQRCWIQQQLESPREAVSPHLQERILERLSAAEGLERYLHTKYVGQKRFSLEGGESLIPLLDYLIQQSGKADLNEMIIGMAHRGRLNVLINILGKSPSELYSEFSGVAPDEEQIKNAGDVKYHLGYSSNISTPGGSVHVSLAFNPSHLEIVGPVVEGSVRARQQRYGDHCGNCVMPVLIHGDSAFAGQGVVMETLQMSQARGYCTGGTIHIIVNNQIGFTTSHPMDTRSTLYCSDTVKVVQAPIFHVNGDDPEAVLFVTGLALAYRNRYQHDVLIDMVCYRRHGHNEADEPAVTQPVMYRLIRNHQTTRQIYAEKLVSCGVLTVDEPDEIAEFYQGQLDQERVVARDQTDQAPVDNGQDWRPYQQTVWTEPCRTGLAIDKIQFLSNRLLDIPAGFELHGRVEKILNDRKKMAAGAMPIDWGFAETLAYASLLDLGYEVRLSGQDSGRGTFFHRHAVLHNQKDGSIHTPLQHLDPQQPHFVVVDSLLSEEAVLAFEYGYSTTLPEALVIWEAQFGDFANVAQVVIDQFIVSGFTKWKRFSGLVVFLPHGYEGQGAEHSSGRIERFLQSCAEHNIQTCIPTTPAQMFHLLRRQMIRPYRRPLIVFTPKSLLRHKLSVSTLDDLAHGAFATVIPEQDELDPAQITRVVMCSGKVYFDLLQARRQQPEQQVAVIRIEQLYPFPEEALNEVLDRYRHVRDVVWCQEEPKNQGAWDSIQHRLRSCLNANQNLRFVGRVSSAAPAVGYFSLHVQQQQELVNRAVQSLNGGAEDES